MLTRNLSQSPGGSPVGQSLREYYQAPQELPPSWLALVRKLDAVEGNLLLRRMQQAPAVRGWPDNLPLDVPARLRGHRVQAAWLALSLGAFGALGEGQKSESASREARGRGRLRAVVTA